MSDLCNNNTPPAALSCSIVFLCQVSYSLSISILGWRQKQRFGCRLYVGCCASARWAHSPCCRRTRWLSKPSSFIGAKTPRMATAGWSATASSWWVFCIRRMWLSRSWQPLLLLLDETQPFQKPRGTSRCENTRFTLHTYKTLYLDHNTVIC